MYDVIVVGSGASGGAVAYRLVQAGYRVALLEKGALLTREDFSKDELAYCRRDLVTPNLQEEYHVIEQKVNGVWVATPTFKSQWSFWNGNIVGGSSNLMSGMVHRMHPDDFRLKSKYGEIKGANVVDWPISYEELSPYYDEVEALVGISGCVEKHPFLPPRKEATFFQPPTKENALVKEFDRSCHSLGITPLVTPRAILSQPYAHREGCLYSNFCGSYGCSSGAKGSAREAFIVPALATGRLTLLPHTHVKKLHTTKEKVTSVSVIHTKTNKERELKAKYFVLAAQAHESVRLLLNSANRFYPFGVANSSRELGKNLIFSGGGVGRARLKYSKENSSQFEAWMRRGLFVNRSILDWYFVDHWWDGYFKGGLVEFMFESQNVIGRADTIAQEGGKLLWGENLRRSLERGFTQEKSIRFEIFNDWLPHDDSFISLAKEHKDKYGMPVGKLRISGHPLDQKVGQYLAQKSIKILEEMGAKEIEYRISDMPAPNLIAGGCRFGNNPKESVLNKMCQTHDIDNLYVADASFMPTGGSVPYTWTIYANALRVADGLIERLSKG